MTAEDIKRVYGTIRKVVPENIDLKEGIDYEVVAEPGQITIYEHPRRIMIYFCKFKIQEKGNF